MSYKRLCSSYADCVPTKDFEPNFGCIDNFFYNAILAEHQELKVGELYVNYYQSEYIDFLISDENFSQNKEKVKNGFSGKITPHANEENYQSFLIIRGNLFSKSWFRIFHMYDSLWSTLHPST